MKQPKEKRRNYDGFVGYGQKNTGELLTSRRSTTYPCYIPVLGDSVGAGRIRLTSGTKVIPGFKKTNLY